MATGSTSIYSLPYPKSTDPVDVAGDIQDLAERMEVVLPELSTPNTKLTAYNGSASAISVGDPVYISGIYSLTDDPEVTKSQASDLNTMPSVGIAASNINPGNSGDVIIFGVVDADLNTSSYNIGDYLYVSASGGLTSTQPAYPNYSQQIALVLKSDVSEGRIMMLPGNKPGTLTWGQMTYS